MAIGKLNHHNAGQYDPRPTLTHWPPHKRADRIEKEDHRFGIHSVVYVMRCGGRRGARLDMWCDRLGGTEPLYFGETLLAEDGSTLGACIDEAKRLEACVRAGWHHAIYRWEQGN